VRYSSGWKHWCRFLKKWYDTEAIWDPTLRGVKESEKVHMLASFASYLRSETKAKAASTISNALSAVRNGIREEFGSVDAFTHESLKACRRALKNPYNGCAREDVNKRPSRLPFTRDLLIDAANALMKRRTADAIMTATALMTAFMGAMRVGEYCESPLTTHEILVEYVEFDFGDGRWWSWGPDRAIPALRPMRSRATLTSSKTDKIEEGYTFLFNRISWTDRYEITDLLWAWLRVARHGPGDLFFSHRIRSDGSQTTLKQRWINLAVKEAAKRAGSDHRRFSTHSIRHGATTTIRADDLTTTRDMQGLGRWRSTTMPAHYGHESRASLLRLQRVLSSNTACSSKDTMDVVPWASRQRQGTSTKVKSPKRRPLRKVHWKDGTRGANSGPAPFNGALAR
jgi:hypothetical protein